MISHSPRLLPTGASLFYPTPAVAAENLQNATLFTRLRICARPGIIANALARSPHLRSTFLLTHYSDILVFDQIQAEHITHVTAVLQMLRDHHLKADIRYCEFDKPSWAEAGFYIDPIRVPGKVAFMVLLREAIQGDQSSSNAEIIGPLGGTNLNIEDRKGRAQEEVLEDQGNDHRGRVMLQLATALSTTQAELQYQEDGTLIVPQISSFTPPTPTTTPQQLFPLQQQPGRQYPRFTHCSHSDTLLIYTDGACLDNGQPSARAGWGFVFRDPEPGQPEGGRVSGRLEDCGPSGEPHPQTSNRAELRAVIAALQFRAWFGEGWTKLVIATDSEYVTKGATEWVRTWGQNRWVTSNRTRVKNQDLWEELLRQVLGNQEQGLEICFWKIPRAWNTTADQISRTRARDEPCRDFSTVTGLTC